MDREAVKREVRELGRFLREAAADRVRRNGAAAKPGRPEREAWRSLEAGDADRAGRIRREALGRGGAHLCGMPDSAIGAFAGERGGASMRALLALEAGGGLRWSGEALSVAWAAAIRRASYRSSKANRSILGVLETPRSGEAEGDFWKRVRLEAFGESLGEDIREIAQAAMDCGEGDDFLERLREEMEGIGSGGALLDREERAIAREALARVQGERIGESAREGPEGQKDGMRKPRRGL